MKEEELKIGEASPADLHSTKCSTMYSVAQWIFKIVIDFLFLMNISFGLESGARILFRTEKFIKLLFSAVFLVTSCSLVEQPRSIKFYRFDYAIRDNYASRVYNCANHKTTEFEKKQTNRTVSRKRSEPKR